MTSTKSNPKTLRFTVLHWIIIQISVFIGVFLQYAFPIDTGEKTGGFFSFAKTKINFPLFLMGSMIIIFVYYFMYKKFLKKDWVNIKDSSKGWKVGFFIICALGMIISFLSAVTAFVIDVLFYDSLPDSAELNFIAVLIYIVFLPVVDFMISVTKDEKAYSRNSFKILGFTLIHWVVVQVSLFGLMYLQFSFTKRTAIVQDWEYTPQKYTYKINPFMYSIGVVLMIAVYYIVWKLLLKKDLIKLKESHIAFKIVYFIIAVLNIVLFLISYVFFLETKFGTFYNTQPEWITYCIFIPITFAVILTIADCIILRKRGDGNET